MTAAELLAQLREVGCVPEMEDGELAFTADPPDTLAGPLEVLRTGVVALLTGRTWWGCDSDTGRSLPLDPRHRIPRHVTLLSLGGESGWERLHPLAFLDLPELFIAPATPKPTPPRRRTESAPQFDSSEHTA